MRLSAGVEWALHCAILLAALPPTGVLSGRALAEFHGISESYLLKQLQALTRTGVFTSTPGPTGGYRLARPAVDITVLDIVEAIEGTESVFRCTDVRTRGPAAVDADLYRVRCGIHTAILRAELAWKQALREQTVADVVVLTSASIAPERVQKARAWIREQIRLTTPQQDRLNAAERAEQPAERG
jgi:Rrf2 family protein